MKCDAHTNNKVLVVCEMSLIFALLFMHKLVWILILSFVVAAHIDGQKGDYQIVLLDEYLM